MLNVTFDRKHQWHEYKYNILPMRSIIENCLWSFAESHFAGIKHTVMIYQHLFFFLVDTGRDTELQQYMPYEKMKI